MNLFHEAKPQLTQPDHSIPTEKKKVYQLQIEQIGKLDNSVNAMLAELTNTKKQTANLLNQLQTFVHEESMTEYLHLQSCITQEGKNTSSDITNQLTNVQYELIRQLESQQANMTEQLSVFMKQQKRIHIITMIALILSAISSIGVFALLIFSFLD